MPSRRCCYCGIEIKEFKKSYTATENDLNNAIDYRKSIGKLPILTAIHVCTGCTRHGGKKLDGTNISTVSF